MKTINLTASRHAVFYSPLIAMVSQGFLENEGLHGTYHIPEPGINVYEKISNKEIDFAQSAVSQSWNFLKNSIPSSIKHFALINSLDGFFIISKNKKEFKWEDLYKDPFYYVRGGQPEAMLKFALDKKNIDINKIKLLSDEPLGTSEMYNSYTREDTGFFHEQGSYPHQLEIDGHGKIIASMPYIIKNRFGLIICNFVDVIYFVCFCGISRIVKIIINAVLSAFTIPYDCYFFVVC